MKPGEMPAGIFPAVPTAPVSTWAASCEQRCFQRAEHEADVNPQDRAAQAGCESSCGSFSG